MWLASDTKGLLRFELIDSLKYADLSAPIAKSVTYAVETVCITLIFFTFSNLCCAATDAVVKKFVGCRRSMLILRGGLLLMILWLLNTFNQ